MAKEAAILGKGKRSKEFLNAIGTIVDNHGFANSPARIMVFRKVAKQCRLNRQTKENAENDRQQIERQQISLFA